MKMRIAAVVLMFLAIAAGPSMASIVEVEVNLGITGNFDTTAGTLNWTDGVKARVYGPGGPLGSYLDVTVTSTFNGCSDNSTGGIASAAFNPGAAWTVLLRNGTNNVLGIQGHTTSSYNEHETSPGFLYGGAVAYVDSMTLYDTSYFGGSAQFDGGNVIGIKATTTLPSDISNYGSNWHSSNVIMTLVADETTIPEPATMCLLGLGVLGLLKRRS